MRKLLVIFLVILLTLSIVACGSDNKQEDDSNEVLEMNNSPEDESKEDENITDITYEIITKEDISTGNAIRYSYRILVEDGLSEEELVKVSKIIIEKEIISQEVNAINLFIYDAIEDSDSVYTVGKVEWAPYGDWVRAAEVKKGDYSNHDYSFDFKIKDISNKPSNEEIEIYNYINSELGKPENPSNEATPEGLEGDEIMEYLEELSTRSAEYEKKVMESAAIKYGKSIEQIDDIYIKVFTYKIN